MITETEIRTKLATDQKWLERAVIVIYSRQTATEQSSRTTINDNGIGFSASDANVMSYCATWINKGNHLSGKFLDRARKIMPKYSKQLLKIAQAREAAKAAMNHPVAAA